MSTAGPRLAGSVPPEDGPDRLQSSFGRPVYNGAPENGHVASPMRWVPDFSREGRDGREYGTNGPFKTIPARDRAGGADKSPVRQPQIQGAGRGRHAASHSSSGQAEARRPAPAPALPADASLQLRLVTLGISLAFALSIGAIAAGYSLDVGALRLAGILGVLFFGIGTAPLQVIPRSTLSTRLGVAGIVGLATITIGASVMVLSSGWHPLRAAMVLGLAAAAAHLLGCWRAVRGLRWSRAIRSLGLNLRSLLSLSLACTAAGTALWTVAAIHLGQVGPSVGGFLPEISSLWYVGLVLLLAAIALARRQSEAYPMLGLVSLVSALTLTPAMAYGMPRSQSAAKHVDLVQQVISVHYLNRGAGIYQDYSGFFSAVGWLCNLAHITDSMGVAAYWPFIIGLVGLAELRFLFGRLLAPGYRLWGGMTLVVLVNSIGADYFSPQSVGFVVALGVYALVLGRDWPGISEPLRITLLFLAGCSLAVTHELSPYAVGGVLAVLVAFRVIRPWYVPLTSLLPAGLWVLLNWEVVKGFLNFGDLGHLSNFAPPKTIATPGLNRLPIVGYSSHALLLGLLVLIVLACVGFFRHLRDKRSWAFMTSAGVGLVLIVANPYGNEGIFRAALFSIPWLGQLAVVALRKNQPRWITLPFWLVTIGLLATFLVSEFGLDNAGVIRPSDYQAMKVYVRQAAPNSNLLDLSYGDIPVDVTFPPDGYEIGWTQVATRADVRPGGPDAADAAALAQNYLKFAANISSAAPQQLYALWSPASVAYSVDYGLETQAQADKWRSLLAKSPDWHVVFHQGGTYLFHVVVQSTN